MTPAGTGLYAGGGKMPDIIPVVPRAVFGLKVPVFPRSLTYFVFQCLMQAAQRLFIEVRY